MRYTEAREDVIPCGEISDIENPRWQTSLGRVRRAGDKRIDKPFCFIARDKSSVGGIRMEFKTGREERRLRARDGNKT
jgi:hypothetical protein